MPAIDFKDIGDVLTFQLLKGIITAIDSATDTCTVSVGGATLSALLYYHCEPSSELRDNGAISGAAKGFSEGDEVIVLINKEKTSIKVIGHTDGIRRCEEAKIGNYYIFYQQGGLKIAQCAYEGAIEVINTKSYNEVYATNTGYPVPFQLKRFTHIVNGVAQDLYFVATSLYINPHPYSGWVNFCEANPTWPLVANHGNTKITMTPEVLADLNAVNYAVNHEHAYSGVGGEVWKILGPFESGDCVAYYEEIYTKEGIKKVGDLKVGDIVLSYDLEAKRYVYKPIIKIWEKGLLPGVRVGIKNGQSIDITHNHPMWTRTNQQGISHYEKRYFKDIDLSRWWKRRLPIAKKLPYNIKDIEWLTEDLCFVIGHYLAEGWAEGHHVCSSGYDMPEHIFPILKKHDIPYSEYKNNSGVPCIRFLKSKFKTFLERLKENSFDIHLPEEMFHLPGNKLRAILDGFWLGDGHNSNYPQKSGHTSNKQKVYSTSSKQWAEDIQRIGLQLGTSFYVWKQEHHQGLGNKPIYRISHNTNSHYYKDHGYEGLSEIGIARKNIKEIGMVKMRDFEVADTHTFIFKNGLVCHQCEDFALTKAQELLNKGYPASALHIEVGLVSPTSAHAWLVVQTTSGDYALDIIGGDSVKRNSAIRTNTGEEYYGRRRQIGENWAAISPYAWMMNFYNTEYWNYYILDPLLNILHRIPTPYYQRFPQSYTGASFNFSSDNTSIYYQYRGNSDVYLRIVTFSFDGAKVSTVSTRTDPKWNGHVDRVGEIVCGFLSSEVPNWQYIEIISKDGYYDYKPYPSPYDGFYLIEPTVTISPETPNPFYHPAGSSIFHTPFGEEISIYSMKSPQLWCHLEIDNTVYQSFLATTAAYGYLNFRPRSWYNTARMYKDGVSCLSEVCAAVGTTEANLLGLVYIPSTDRLSE